MMDCKVLIIILLIGTILSIRGAPAGINAPELFDKDPRMDKLLVKNHIAYHFRKVVREVNQELFVSRQIDISSLFLGIQVLEHTRDSLSRYCRSLNHTFHNPSTPSIPLGKTENLVVI